MSLTVRQNERLVGVDPLDDAGERRRLEGHFDALSIEDVQELQVVHDHFIKAN